jgi:hypothetical protein
MKNFNKFGFDKFLESRDKSFYREARQYERDTRNSIPIKIAKAIGQIALLLGEEGNSKMHDNLEKLSLFDENGSSINARDNKYRGNDHSLVYSSKIIDIIYLIESYTKTEPITNKNNSFIQNDVVFDKINMLVDHVQKDPPPILVKQEMNSIESPIHWKYIRHLIIDPLERIEEQLKAAAEMEK